MFVYLALGDAIAFENRFQQSFWPTIQQTAPHSQTCGKKEQRLKTSPKFLRFRYIIGERSASLTIIFGCVTCEWFDFFLEKRQLTQYMPDIQGQWNWKIWISTTHFQFSYAETSVVCVPCNCGIWARRLGDKNPALAHCIQPTQTATNLKWEERSRQEH